MSDTHLHGELHELTALYLDNELGEAGCARLNELLSVDPDAAHAFNDYCLHARTLTASLSGRAAIEPNLDQPATRPHTPSVERSASRPIPFAPVAIAIAATLVLAGAILAVYVVAFADPETDVDAPTPAAPVATLIEATGNTAVIVDDNLAFEGQEYAAGAVSIESGSAHFQLTSGASVTMRGRARMVMHSSKLATLMRGTAEFHCPPRAAGYTVLLPGGARVVDLGTAFTIDVDDNGDATVRVTEGLVKLVTAGDAANPSREVELAASMSVHVTGHGRFASAVRKPIKPARYTYVGEFRPATDPAHYDDVANELTDGEIGRGTYTDPRWVGVISEETDPDRARPSILFDLGAAQTVHAVKVTYLVDHEGAVHAPSRAAIAFGDSAESLGEPIEATGFDDSRDPIGAEIGDVREHTIRFEPQTARYFRLDLFNEQEWTFISEVTIEATAPEADRSGDESIDDPAVTEQP